MKSYVALRAVMRIRAQIAQCNGMCCFPMFIICGFRFTKEATDSTHSATVKLNIMLFPQMHFEAISCLVFGSAAFPVALIGPLTSFVNRINTHTSFIIHDRYSCCQKVTVMSFHNMSSPAHFIAKLDSTTRDCACELKFRFPEFLIPGLQVDNKYMLSNSVFVLQKAKKF